jgi:hypothetical protein
MNVQFEKLVESLLQKYECVILPEFGGFIVRESPCNFSASGDRIKPYSKHIFFNPHLTLNDGLVYNEIQTNFGYTYNEAINWYNEQLESLKQVIASAGSASFGKLGTFFQGKENSFWFSPSSDLNLAKSTYGLYPVEIHKVVKAEAEQEFEEKVQTLETKTVAKADRKPIENFEPARLNYKAWIAAAMVALLVHFTYLKLEKTDVTTNEASVLPTFPGKKAILQSNVESVSDSSVANADSAITENTSITPETTEIVSEPVVAEPVVSEPVQSETPKVEIPAQEPVSPAVQTEVPAQTSEVVQTDIQYNRVARYRLEANALSHKKDLEKKGQSAKVEFVNGLYEVLVEQ